MYSIPYELAVIGSNNRNTMSNFMANINIILESIATILKPLLFHRIYNTDIFILYAIYYFDYRRNTHNINFFKN